MWETPKTIPEMLKRNVVDFPEREAFVSVLYETGDWVRHTWKEIDEITDHVASGLAEIGIKKGQKVAFMNTNSAECYYAYLATHKLGAIFVPINVRLVAREVEFIVGHSDAEYIIAGSEFIPLVDQIRSKLSHLKMIIIIDKKGSSTPSWAISFRRVLESKGIPPEVSLGPEDDADLIYTTGTTGLPKGVILTHANKVACGRMLGATLGIRRKYYGWTRLQTPFPFFTSTGVSSILMPWLYYGHTVIMEPSFDVVQTLETIQRERSTYYAAAPSMLIFILDYPNLRDFDTSSLDSILYGGSAMPEEVIRRIMETWPGLKLYNGYGLTEGGTGGTALEASDALRKLGSIGVPWVDQEVRIVDENDRDVAPGEVGEIIIRGPNVMKEYYKNPEATREALKNGWLHTGDMGRYDEDGYIYYTDRKKDMIVRGGFNVYPVEVESVLYEHPAVKQCAVVAKPHPKLGEDVLAFVVLGEGKNVTEKELIEFCKDKLADFKRPREIRFVDSLPINPMGKVDKKALRATFLS
jgi:acyl-CoA synthetase (AMP-forming)/AMP-acid ligase II